MRLSSLERVEEKWDSANVIVAPSAWSSCWCCCCWCHSWSHSHVRAMTSYRDDEEL